MITCEAKEQITGERRTTLHNCFYGGA